MTFCVKGETLFLERPTLQAGFGHFDFESTLCVIVTDLMRWSTWFSLTWVWGLAQEKKTRGVLPHSCHSLFAPHSILCKFIRLSVDIFVVTVSWNMYVCIKGSTTYHVVMGVDCCITLIFKVGVALSCWFISWPLTGYELWHLLIRGLTSVGLDIERRSKVYDSLDDFDSKQVSRASV